jgi:hypothetical protein
MAVLKSPRNTKKKNQWVTRYIRNNKVGTYLVEDKKSMKAHHKLERFLMASDHWVQPNTGPQSRLLADIVPTYFPSEYENEIPQSKVKFASKRRVLDIMGTSPLIARSELRTDGTRKRLFFLLNSTHLDL